MISGINFGGRLLLFETDELALLTQRKLEELPLVSRDYVLHSTVIQKYSVPLILCNSHDTSLNTIRYSHEITLLSETDVQEVMEQANKAIVLKSAVNDALWQIDPDIVTKIQGETIVISVRHKNLEVLKCIDYCDFLFFDGFLTDAVDYYLHILEETVEHDFKTVTDSYKNKMCSSNTEAEIRIDICNELHNLGYQNFKDYYHSFLRKVL